MGRILRNIMKRINHNGIIWIIVILIATATCFCSCEAFEPHPNLTVTNAYHDGYIQVGFVLSDEQIVYEPMAFGQKKQFYLEQGHYFVRLIVDSQTHPELSDRRMSVYLSTQYTFCELTFKDKY